MDKRVYNLLSLSILIIDISIHLLMSKVLTTQCQPYFSVLRRCFFLDPKRVSDIEAMLLRHNNKKIRRI